MGGIRTPQNPGIGGLDELTDAEEVFLTAFAGVSWTQGSLLFIDGSGIPAQDNDNLFWDDSNNFLGVGTSSPGQRLHVAGSVLIDNGLIVTQGFELKNGFLWDGTADRSLALGSVGGSSDGKSLSFVAGAASGPFGPSFDGGDLLIDGGTGHGGSGLDGNILFVTVGTEGKVGIGATPTAKLHVDQPSTTATIPVLTLDQADTSEEMIEFVTTIGTGNPIEAIASKTLTTTHFIKVTIPGGLTRYIPCGTIA